MKKFRNILILACLACALCGVALAGCGGDVPQEEHVHSVPEWTVEEAPTCSKEGQEGGACSECHEWVTRAIPKTEHTFVQTEVLAAPSCTAEGRAKVRCSVCGAESEQTLPAAHDWKTTKLISSAGCVTDGSREVECRVCGTKDTIAIPALGHNYGEGGTVVKDATCTEAGAMKKTCTRCGEEGEVPTPALGHDWADDYTIDEMFSATSRGSRSIHCNRCDAKKNVTPILSEDGMLLYELRITRNSGKLIENSGVSIGFEVVDGTGAKVAGGSTKRGTASIPLKPDTYTLNITSVSGGYSAEAQSYSLSPDAVTAGGKVVCEIPLTGALRAGTAPANTSYAEDSALYDFTLPTLTTNARPESETLTLSTLLQTYKAVVLNFWFVGCQWCRYEFPGLEAAYKQYQSDVAVIAIDPLESDTDASVRSFVNQQGLSFYIARDAQIASFFHVSSYPTTVVIDREGIAAEIHATALVNAENPDDLAYCTAQFRALFERYVSSAPAASSAPALPARKRSL